MAILTVKIPQSDGSHVIEDFKVDLSIHRPADLIQFLYQKGYKPAGGGSTIWKMGRAVAGDLDECRTFEANNVPDHTALFVSEA